MKSILLIRINFLIILLFRFNISCLKLEDQKKVNKNNLVIDENIESHKEEFKSVANSLNAMKGSNLKIKQNSTEDNRRNAIVNILTAVEKKPQVTIKSIDTHILITKDKTDGRVFEKIQFYLQDGMFDSVMKKVSLGGTSDNQYGFKLASS